MTLLALGAFAIAFVSGAVSIIIIAIVWANRTFSITKPWDEPETPDWKIDQGGIKRQPK